MNLDELRSKIDEVDQQIVSLLGKRLEIVKEVGHLKAKSGAQVRDNDRFAKLMSRLKEQASSNGVPPDLVERIYHEIHEAAIASQEDLKVQ